MIPVPGVLASSRDRVPREPNLGGGGAVNDSGGYNRSDSPSAKFENRSDRGVFR